MVKRNESTKSSSSSTSTKRARSRSRNRRTSKKEPVVGDHVTKASAKKAKIDESVPSGASLGGMARLAEIPFTEEQQKVINLAKKPGMIPACGEIIRVTSAAGTGKTTTLEGVAARLLDLGHDEVLYLTFNRAQAKDAKQRIGGNAICRTLHSQAFHACGIFENGAKLISENQLDSLIVSSFGKDIKAFIMTGSMYGPGKRQKESEIPIQLIKKIAFYIRKTLVRFLQSKDSIKEGFDPNQYKTTYYPARLYHNDDAAQEGLPTNFDDFYVSHAKKLHEMVRPKSGSDGGGGTILYDTVMKHAQLNNLEIPGTIILVDESQDCNECQISWVLQQKARKQVFFVGDAVQTLYSFRGAKAKFLMDIGNCIDASLTLSFRFGHEIAHIANLILFTKHHSPQLDWVPYRIKGMDNKPGQVVAFENFENFKERRAILARSNVQLLKRALEIYAHWPKMKFAVNGEGENSGRKKWKSAMDKFQPIFELYMRERDSLPESFYEFQDETHTFQSFKEAVRGRELGDYSWVLSIIDEHGKSAKQVVESFVDRVVKEEVPIDEADIILSTIHSAKGMEFDCVEVCGDIMKLGKIKVQSANDWKKEVWQFKNAVDMKTMRKEKIAKFDIPNYGDDLNIVYVAVTRAKRKLILPKQVTTHYLMLNKSIPELLQTEDFLQAGEHQLFPIPVHLPFETPLEEKEENLSATKDAQIFLKDDVSLIYQQLCQKWIEEKPSNVNVDFIEQKDIGEQPNQEVPQ